MNQKDRNLVKACALLVLLVLALGFAFNKALHLAGDPLRVVGAIFSAYYLARAAVAVARRRRRPKVRARRRVLSLSLSPEPSRSRFCTLRTCASSASGPS